MKLVIFDVDGTLTDTNQIDGVCFQRALQEEFGIPPISMNWETYSHTTDIGIAREVLASYFHHEPDTYELERARKRFVRLLKEAHRANPKHFREIRGARDILQHLQNDGDWKLAIATGCWADSALFKLQNAGIPASLPFASCEDSVSRDAIVGCAIGKAKLFYNCLKFSSVVFVGDGVWDVIAARTLRIGFIGIGSDARLRKAGARYICKSFRPSQRFINYLSELSDYARTT